MKETTFLTKFRARVRKLYPGIWIYKIPDTRGLGGMRPFDMIALYQGITFCIEGKRDSKAKLTEYQKHNLREAEKNGAISFVVFPENEEYWLSRIGELANE